MTALPPVKARRGRRRVQIVPRLAHWLVTAVSVYWTLLFARWCAWVLGRAISEPEGLLDRLHFWLGWPFVLLPGATRFPVLADIVGVLVSGGIVVVLIGVLGGWWREGGSFSYPAR